MQQKYTTNYTTTNSICLTLELKNALKWNSHDSYMELRENVRFLGSNLENYLQNVESET